MIAACLVDVLTSPNVCHLYFLEKARMVAFNSEEMVVAMVGDEKSYRKMCCVHKVCKAQSFPPPEEIKKVNG